jgi:ribokinase
MKLRSLATAPPDVVVVGSLNVDLIAQVPGLPAPGETVAATGLLRRFGGKGANQAVAAARQGARVALIGCVGRDADGEAYRQRLAGEGITATGVRTAANVPTGTAFINVDARGENQIIVVAGANARLGAADIRAQAGLIRAARVLLTQLEVPLPAVLEAMRLANAAGVPVVFNPSPLRQDFPWGHVALDSVIVNDLEARLIFGAAVARFAARPSVRRSALTRTGVRRLLVTRGARPTLCFTAEAVLEVPTLRVKPVDTVGAGDAFAGTFAAQLAAGRDWSEAVAWANAAGALATLKPGAQEAMPTRAATRLALAHRTAHARS